MKEAIPYIPFGCIPPLKRRGLAETDRPKTNMKLFLQSIAASKRKEHE